MKIETKDKSVIIDGVEYVEAGSVNTPAQNIDGMPYVLIRGKDAGCHAGYLKEKTATSVILLNDRRLWYWDGAATLSQLAVDGVSKLDKCKFPCEVSEVEINNWCEVIMATEKARLSIKGVPVWTE